MEEFKIGDVVQLKSGGPKMTVDNPDAQNVIPAYIGRIGCQWFAGSKLEHGFFPKEALVKVSDAKKE